GGGFCATARDYARLGQLVLDQGRGVVPAAYTLQLGNGHPPAFAATTVPDATSGADGYRHQWWRRDGRTMARGIHGQMICVDRQTRTVVAVLSSWPDATDARREAAHRELVARVCAALGDG
ncbi:MAG TPA: serine hydrolase, partial [Solirubrobacteraceae bacterium]|nr:serine hydrolase [Solirubrobacteraceae bacterium]